MNKLTDKLMTKDEINNVKSFDDIMFRKSSYSTDKFTARTFCAEFENGNKVSFIEDYKEGLWHNWNCKVSLYTDEKTNEYVDTDQYGGVIEFDVKDTDELLRIFLLNRDYTHNEITTHIVENNNEYESWKEYAFDKWGAIESDEDLIGYLRRFKDYVIDVPMDYNANGGYGFPSTLTEQEKMRLINTMLEMSLRYIIENERRK